MVLLSTPMDGEYRVRVTSGALRGREEAAVRAHDDSFWIDITGSRLRIGALENLPGAADANQHTAEQTIIIPNGRYRLDLYGLEAPHSPPTDLPNVIVRLTPVAPSDTASQPKERPELWPKAPRERVRKGREKPQAREGQMIARGAAVDFDCEMSTEMIGLFDPAEMAHAATRPPEWTMDEAAVISEARAGRLSFAYSSAISLRTARIRIQAEPLTMQQAKEVIVAAPKCWLRISSGQVCCAPSEEWPASTTPQIGPAGRTFSLEEGRYTVEFYFLKPQGPVFPIVVEISPLSDPAGPAPESTEDVLPVGYERSLKKRK
jgi:hypothetical protein